MQSLVIAGNVGKDAELRQTGSGDPVLNFTVAVNNGKDRDGNERPPSWFDCALWGKRATALQSYIRKGDKITVSGRPTAREHNGKAYLGINVDQLTLQGGSGGNSGGGSNGYSEHNGPQGDGYGGADDQDSIPF